MCYIFQPGGFFKLLTTLSLNSLHFLIFEFLNPFQSFSHLFKNVFLKSKRLDPKLRSFTFGPRHVAENEVTN